jgi:hypothetical protein
MNELIHCINCNEIFLKTPFDQWPEYEPPPGVSLESFRMIEKDDFQNFLKNHHGHRLEKLKILEDSLASEKDYFEPVKTSYFRATNGRENFVVKRFRANIEEPLKYQVVSEDYSVRCAKIEIQSKEVEQQLRAEFNTKSLPANKIEAFLKLLHYIARTVDIEKLERISEESSNPLEIYYKMDDISLVYLLRNCRNIFDGQEYLKIVEFIDRHKDDGVLLLKARYEMLINRVAKSKQEPVSAQASLKMKKVADKKG